MALFNLNANNIIFHPQYEDRKSVISSLRKALQEVSLKVANLEGQLSKEKQESERKIEDLNQFKIDLQVRINIIYININKYLIYA